jgi:AraC-like DNA-binding protein
MSGRLDHITDWVALAKGARFRVAKVASACGLSPRQLERCFQAQHHAAPHPWLRDLRMRLAVELIGDQTPIKVVAFDLGYKDPAHFTQDFKRYFGVCPSRFNPRQPGAILQTQPVAS